MNVQSVAMSGKPTIISTFAGCGGSSLGYKWAGFKELLAIEWDQNAVDTFKLNFPDVPVWQKDIREVKGKEILEFTGLKPGQLDVLDGSPPCQGFSMARGKRSVTDDRNDLSYEFIRLINELKPKVFVMENVAGMVKGKMRGRFKEIMIALKETGYNVRCKMMNSVYYDVPQSRQRLIWIGVKSGEPKYPEPNQKNIYPKKLDSVYSKYSEIRYGDVIIKEDRPAVTVTTAGRLFWNKNEQIGLNSYKYISSFPLDFKFIGPFNQVKDRIGNAVMPKFMEHIARTIKNKIL